MPKGLLFKKQFTAHALLLIFHVLMSYGFTLIWLCIDFNYFFHNTQPGITLQVSEFNALALCLPIITISWCNFYQFFSVLIMISCLSFGHNFLKKKNKHNIFCITIYVPARRRQASLNGNPISTMAPIPLIRSTATQNKIPIRVLSPHSRKKSEPVSHDDCACCVARCLHVFRCSLKL